MRETGRSTFAYRFQREARVSRNKRSRCDIFGTNWIFSISFSLERGRYNESQIVNELLTRNLHSTGYERRRRETGKPFYADCPFSTTRNLLSGIQRVAMVHLLARPSYEIVSPMAGRVATRRYRALKLKACSCRAGTSLVVLFRVYYLPLRTEFPREATDNRRIKTLERE